ncbi:conserved unknown protein [Ectocarpus siliculosus]|uniref:Sialate O-acetylesterase domain-containing protein n=1 Tax=Ectocarpus siliculosus TaxID=2880 RepID=D7FNI7_ECTSI|nr:conserved unknown protein [Ectocarpus siliculosus]|eukprot:CBJ25998.1 conserved unknown protein [Ectocarpus siliculosus]
MHNVCTRGLFVCILISSALSTCSTSVSADCTAKRDVAGSDVVLLMGQSNMSGWGEGYDADIDGPNDPRIQQWSRDNTVITASERLQHADHGRAGKRRVGMGTAFGRAFVKTLPANRNVLLVPTAFGATRLVNGPWSPGGNLFEDAVTRMEAALASNGAAGNCVAAILWHQGESDAGDGIDQETYQSIWTNMINTLRSRIPAAAEAPVILGEFTPHMLARNRALSEPIIAAIRAIPDSVPFTAVAPSDGLSTNSVGPVHFDAVGQREYGQRYFDKLDDAVRNSHSMRS